MESNNILLVIAALLPAIALCIYIFKKDRAEKEPIGLLLGLLLLGGLIGFLAGDLEGILFRLIDSIFMPYTVEVDGSNYLSGMTYEFYNICKYFIGVALVEEGLKFIVLLLVTRKNKNFNSLFDGLIYAVFVSLGFAALENVFYVLEYGWETAITRALMSVPGHMFFAVLMGYYYSLWHIYDMAKQQERKLKRSGLISKEAVEFSGRKYLLLSIVVPTAAHGLYDYCCSAETTTAVLFFFAFIIFLYIYCFRKIRMMSKSDTSDVKISNALILKKYPHLLALLIKNQDNSANSDAGNEYNKLR